MTHTLGTMRSEVRASLDATRSDIPDQLTDKWLREGWDYVLNYTDWPFLLDTQDVKVGENGKVLVERCRKIRNIIWEANDGPRVLVPMSFTEARRADYLGRFSNDEPVAWSLVGPAAEGLSVQIWAPPPVDATVTVDRVYQPPAWPPADAADDDSVIPVASGEENLPASMVLCMINYAVSRGYTHLGDNTPSRNYLGVAENSLRQYALRVIPGRRPQFQVGGGLRVGDLLAPAPDRSTFLVYQRGV